MSQSTQANELRLGGPVCQLSPGLMEFTWKVSRWIFNGVPGVFTGGSIPRVRMTMTVWKDLQTSMTMPRHIQTNVQKTFENHLFSKLAFMVSQICSSLESHKSYHILPLKKGRTSSRQTSRQNRLWHCQCSCRAGCCRGSRSWVGRCRQGMDGLKNLIVTRG